MYAIKNLSYRYQEKKVLDAANLTIADGDYLVLMGENGSGKTTFLNLLAGFLKAESGEIDFNDLSVKSWQKDTVSRKKFYAQLGIMFQETDHQLFNNTVYDEIAFGPRQLQLSEEEVAKRVADCLTLMGIEQLKQRVPYQLSGGEKKKVAFASILAMNPQVFLLDEPFTGLTNEAVQQFKKILADLHSLGKTIILSCHSYQTFAEDEVSFLLFEETLKVFNQAEIKKDPALHQQLLKY